MEDDYDAEHRYDRAPVPALQGLVPDQVVYAGSVSKTLAPGLRLGWVVAPAALCAALTRAKYMADLGNPVLDQLVFARFLASGEFERHVRRVRIRQRARRDAMLGALREHLPHAQVLGVAAGLHLLVTLPEAPTTSRWRPRRTRQACSSTRSRPTGSRPDPRARAGLRRAGAGPHPRGDRPARRGVPLCRTPASARVTARA